MKEGLQQQAVNAQVNELKAAGTVQAVYFFCGIERKGDLAHWLKRLCPTGVKLTIHEVDLLRGGAAHDLSQAAKQQEFLQLAAESSIVICTPPCSDFSRAKWSNNLGPAPLRSARYPDGFPWLSAKARQQVELHNSLINFTWTVAQQNGRKQWQVFLAEHPEDLGRVRNQPAFAVPASIWKSQEFASLWQAGWFSCGFLQCAYGSSTPKPTRFLSSDHIFASFGPNTLPTFDTEDFYTGPVVKCDRSHSDSLIRKAGDTGPFKTAAAAAYPSDMCQKIAECLWKAWKNKTPVPTLSGLAPKESPKSKTSPNGEEQFVLETGNPL
jgi:hypothetical protein